LKRVELAAEPASNFNSSAKPFTVLYLAKIAPDCSIEEKAAGAKLQ